LKKKKGRSSRTGRAENTVQVQLKIKGVEKGRGRRRKPRRQTKFETRGAEDQHKNINDGKDSPEKAEKRQQFMGDRVPKNRCKTN